MSIYDTLVYDRVNRYGLAYFFNSSYQNSFMKNPKKAPITNKDEQEQRLDDLQYPSSQDIMSKDKRVDIDPESLPGRPMPYTTNNNVPVNQRPGQGEDDIDLDIPGAELDDNEERTGSEDEENNYYSLSDDKDKED
jgi:hypothetical protein